VPVDRGAALTPRGIVHAVFGLWKRRPQRVRSEDRIYSRRARADRALLDEATDGAAPTLVASFFPASLRRVEQALVERGVPTSTLTARARPPLPLPPDAGPWLLDANHLTLDVGLPTWLERADVALRILFVEHFPLARAEAAALGVIAEIGATHPHQVRFFVGLDDPMMMAFGGERIIALMERLGMAPDEVISHPMVSQAVVTAQRRLERRLTATQPADSDAEWFRLNARGD